MSIFHIFSSHISYKKKNIELWRKNNSIWIQNLKYNFNHMFIYHDQEECQLYEKNPLACTEKWPYLIDYPWYRECFTKTYLNTNVCFLFLLILLIIIFLKRKYSIPYFKYVIFILIGVSMLFSIDLYENSTNKINFSILPKWTPYIWHFIKWTDLNPFYKNHCEFPTN